MTTHKEKDEVIKKLKDKITELGEKTKDLSEDLNTDGLSVIKEGLDYFLVKIKFDVKTGRGKIVERINFGKDPAIVIYKAKEYLIAGVINDARKS